MARRIWVGMFVCRAKIETMCIGRSMVMYVSHDLGSFRAAEIVSENFGCGFVAEISANSQTMDKKLWCVCLCVCAAKCIKLGSV